MKSIRNAGGWFETYPVMRFLFPLVAGIAFGEVAIGWFAPSLVLRWCLWGATFLLWSLLLLLYRRPTPVLQKYYPFHILLAAGVMTLGVAINWETHARLRPDWPASPHDFRVVLVQSPKDRERSIQAVGEILDGPFAGKRVALVLLKARVADKDASRMRKKDAEQGFRTPSQTVVAGSSSDAIPVAADCSVVSVRTECHLADRPDGVLDAASATMNVASHADSLLIQKNKSAIPHASLVPEEKSDSCNEINSIRDPRVCSSLRLGDVVLCHGRIAPLRRTFYHYGFDWARWQEQQGIAGRAFCFSTHWQRSASTAVSLPWRIRFLQWRDSLVAQYATHWEGRALSILSAMTLGDRSRLDSATRDVFSQSGVSHVLALSGLHLAILFFFYQHIVLQSVRRRIWIALLSILGLVGLWGFALLAGLPLSLVRAALMFTFLQLSRIKGEGGNSINNLALAALLVLVVSPLSLFDVGFQLSCLSVLSILLWGQYVPVPAWVERYAPFRWVYGLVSVTFSAQLGTLPLVAYYFHSVPLIGLVANWVAVPLAYLVLAFALLFFFTPWLRCFWVAILSTLLEWMHFALAHLSSLPFSSLRVYPSAGAVFLFYILLVLLFLYLVQRRPWQRYLCLSVFFALFVVEEVVHRPHRLQPQLICYDAGSVPVVHLLFSTDRSYIWSPDTLCAQRFLSSVRRSFWEEARIAPPQWMAVPTAHSDFYFDASLLSVGGRRIAFVYDRLPKGKPGQALKVDYLLLARSLRSPLSEVLQYYRPRQLVLDTSLPEAVRERYAREAHLQGLPVADIAELGGFCVDLSAEMVR